MAIIVAQMLGIIITAGLAGRAGQTEQLFMQRPQQGPTPQPSQSITFPNGTTFGGASGRQASELAQITLFFPTGSHELRQGQEQYTRLITFLDYLSRQSRGRKVLFLLIGSASATGNPQVNERLSRERATAPEPIIDQYLVNIPHQFFKVYGLGDIYSPKHAPLTQEQRYQNVRIIAVYDTDQVPQLPAAAKS
jgi:hypothetical protein